MRITVKGENGRTIGYADVPGVPLVGPLKMDVTVLDETTIERIQKGILGGVSIGPVWVDESQRLAGLVDDSKGRGTDVSPDQF